jgi:hypothetical protein
VNINSKQTTTNKQSDNKSNSNKQTTIRDSTYFRRDSQAKKVTSLNSKLTNLTNCNTASIVPVPVNYIRPSTINLRPLTFDLRPSNLQVSFYKIPINLFILKHWTYNSFIEYYTHTNNNNNNDNNNNNKNVHLSRT